MTPLDQLKLETFCAGKIRYSQDSAERLQAYDEAYGVFFASVGNHPQFNLADSVYSRYSRQLVDKIAPILDANMLSPSNIAEFGCGRGFLTAELAQRYTQAKCIGVDVAIDAITHELVPNLSYIKANILQDNITIENVDLIVSDQVLEHIHVDDVNLFISKCARSARKGGFVFIGTPNRIWGPHDISGLFNISEPIGFHLKEYGCQEVVDICLQHGLDFECAIIMLRNYGVVLSLKNYLRLEYFIGKIPFFIRCFMREKRLLGWANIRFLFKKI